MRSTERGQQPIKFGVIGALEPDGEVRSLSAALSHACHYHPYELAPTAAELTGWLDQAAQTVTLMQAASAASASQG